MTGKSCWNCRDRKVSCDRSLPTCERCARSNTPCKGYNIRLSWPKAVNRKRCVVGKSPTRGTQLKNVSSFRLVNASFRDIELYYNLLTASSDPSEPPLPVPLKLLPPPGILHRLDTDRLEPDLLQYFQHNGWQLLATFGFDPKDLSELLLRMALADDSPSSTAILKSVIALSSHHRYGPGHEVQVEKFKLAAIKALKEASQSPIGRNEAVRHIAAIMTLCSTETSRSDDWAPYINSIKKIMIAGSLKSEFEDDDLQYLIAWAYFYEAIGHFSAAHWSRCLIGSPKESPGIETYYPPPASLRTLGLFGESCIVVSIKTSSFKCAEEQEKFIGRLRTLEHKISRTLRPELSPFKDCNGRLIMELYKLGILVYLGRACSDLVPGLAAKTEQRLKRAFSLLWNLEYCDRKFPLFILGCEARSEEDRASFLDLVAKTKERSAGTNIERVEALVQTSWTQSDLAHDGNTEISYVEKLNALIGSCEVMPAFV